MPIDGFARWFATLVRESDFQVQKLLDDKSAVYFLIAWSLFESKCFRRGRIDLDSVETFAKTVVRSGFDVRRIREPALHFHARYQNRLFLANLLHEKKRPSDESKRLRELLGTPFEQLSSEELVWLTTYVVYRFRNNIFHGNKGVSAWLRYEPQIANCTSAMQAFVSHAEAIESTLSWRVA